MANTISFQKRKEEIEFERNRSFLENPFDIDSSFSIKLSSLELSALLFIHDYLNPKNSDSLQEKMNLQFTLASNLAQNYFTAEKEISYKYYWWFNEFLSRDGYIFKVNRISNFNFYNYMLNQFENEDLSGPNILRESLTMYIQLFYNQINNLEDSSLFPDFTTVKKKAMGSSNQNLVRIIDSLEKGKILSFLPIKRNKFEYITSL